MNNEELKTFIDKMRAAGKNDTEIAAELKTAGWAEADIVSVLNPQSISLAGDQSPIPSSPAPSPEIQVLSPTKKLPWVWVGVAGLILIVLVAAGAVMVISSRRGSAGGTIPTTSSGLPASSPSTTTSVINSNTNDELKSSFYESSDIGNASTVKIRPPKDWYGSVWGSIPNLIAVLKPNGYSVKEYSYPFVDINIVQVGTKSVSVISPDNNALLEKWITNNNVLPPQNDSEYPVNIINKEFRKFNIGYGSSNAYYVEFNFSSNKPQDTKDGPVSKLKFARILVEAKNPNFAFDIKIVDSQENWNKNINKINNSLTTLTGRGAVEENYGL